MFFLISPHKPLPRPPVRGSLVPVQDHPSRGARPQPCSIHHSDGNSFGGEVVLDSFDSGCNFLSVLINMQDDQKRTKYFSVWKVVHDTDIYDIYD